jgi:sulfur dioxygenase
MIFRQLFDTTSSTYTYLIAGRHGGEALIIDPVLERVDRYIKLMEELDVKLVKAVDTHVHADHITGLGELRDRTRCITVMGEESGVDVVSSRVGDGSQIVIDGVALDAMHTPGHTSDSYSFLMGDRVFTGDTLLIRGTGRTDFQNGNPVDQYDSIFNRLLNLPDEMLVYPAHDYKGDTVTTIGEERAFNPRLQVDSCDEYVDIMNALNLPDPRMMDVAVPANLVMGLDQDAPDRAAWTLDAEGVIRTVDSGRGMLVDLRETDERERDGVIPGAVHAPYTNLSDHLQPDGLLWQLATTSAKRIIFFCAYGERSAMAVEAARDAGLSGVAHMKGGIGAWKKADGPLRK